MIRSSFLPATKGWMVALLGVTLVSLADTASAQTIFSTNFDNYTPAQSLSGQTDPVYGGQWNTNDPDNGGTYTYGSNRTGTIGQSDDVDNVSGFSTANQSDYSATLGGNFAGAIVPGTPTVIVDHTVDLGSATTASFNFDFAVTSSGGSFPAKDSFSIQFGTGTGPTASSLFNLNFTPSVDGSATDNIGYNSVGVVGNTNTGNFNLNAKYHLAVNVNRTQKTFTAILSIPGTTGSLTVANGIAYSGTISDFALVWKLQNSNVTTPGTNGTTAYSSPGNNFLAIDNIVVSVPEPSTYVLFGLGIVALGAVLRSRRHQAA